MAYAAAEAKTREAVTAMAASSATRLARVPRKRTCPGAPWWPCGAPMGSGLLEHVADPTHRVDQARLALGLGLAPQVADVDLEGVGSGGEVVAPDLLQDERPVEHPARSPQEHLHQGELGAGHFDLPVAAPHLPGEWVEAEVG